jgi:hypothetical protein
VLSPLRSPQHVADVIPELLLRDRRHSHRVAELLPWLE